MRLRLKRPPTLLAARRVQGMGFPDRNIPWYQLSGPPPRRIRLEARRCALHRFRVARSWAFQWAFRPACGRRRFLLLSRAPFGASSAPFAVVLGTLGSVTLRLRCPNGQQAKAHNAPPLPQTAAHLQSGSTTNRVHDVGIFVGSSSGTPSRARM